MTDADAEQLAFGKEYDERVHLYEALMDEVLFTLKLGLKEANIKTHSISGRVKDRSGFIEKISRKDYSDPFVEMPDIFGARIVCLFTDDLPKIREVIRTSFHVIEEEDKIQGVPADSFGYMSVHYRCTLRDEHSGPRYDRIKQLSFELQSRTLLMDAWANVSHHLAYKGEASIPESLKRDFHALSGLFYVADRHFQFFYNESEHNTEATKERVRQSGPRVVHEVNRDTVSALFESLYPDRKHAPLSIISEFVEEIDKVGYTSIEELSDALARAASVALDFEAENPPGATPGRKFADVGLARTALSIADPNYEQSRRRKNPHIARYRELLEGGNSKTS